jgi:hypothetical protein
MPSTNLSLETGDDLFLFYEKNKVFIDYLKMILAENTAVGIRHADHVAFLYPLKLALTLQASGGRYSSLADSGHGVLVYFIR